MAMLLNALAPITRTQGCWNCKHFVTGDKVKSYFLDTSTRDLVKTAERAKRSPLGAKDPAVMEIRANFAKVAAMLDEEIPRIGLCGENKQPGMIMHAYLCDHWSGAQGASIARAGEKADALPEELMEERFAEAGMKQPK